MIHPAGHNTKPPDKKKENFEHIYGRQIYTGVAHRTCDGAGSVDALQSGQVLLVRSHALRQRLWNMWPHDGRTWHRSPPASYGSMQITHSLLSLEVAAEPS